MKALNFLLVILFPFPLFSQISVPVTAKAYYKLTHHYDQNDIKLSKTENYVVYLGRSESVYKSYDRILQDSAMLKNFALNGGFSTAGQVRYKDDEIYILNTSKESYHRTSIISRALGDYLLKFQFPEIQWTIINKTKKIKGIVCQSARGTFGGRTYTAWFAETLPFNAGPWKLRGLPGLILSAYDDSKRISFEFISFEKATKTNELISSKKAQKISEPGFQKLARAYFANPKAFLETQVRGTFKTSAPIKPKKYRNLLAPDPSVTFPLEVGGTIYE